MHKPGMILTGATGFLGSSLIRHWCNDYRIFSIARRPQRLAGLPPEAQIEWLQADIGDYQALSRVFERINALGGAEIMLHLAGYYDFTGEYRPEYMYTNVVGTRNVLELSAPLGLRKLFFTSSIAACPFPPPGAAITEDTPPIAPPPYSQSKRQAEELLAMYVDRVPACILRLAAIFSDWCEYEPLFNFLETWFSDRWNARILGGHGLWAIPYLHMHDLLAFFVRVIEYADQIEPLEVLQASPNGCTTHRDLFLTATGCCYGNPLRPLYVPKLLARGGIKLREIWGRVHGPMPFERSWMGEYIDRQLNVDATRTQRRLNWQPHPERAVLACIPTMVRNRAADPSEWQLRFEKSKKGKPVRLQALT